MINIFILSCCIYPTTKAKDSISYISVQIIIGNAIFSSSSMPNKEYCTISMIQKLQMCL